MALLTDSFRKHVGVFVHTCKSSHWSYIRQVPCFRSFLAEFLSRLLILSYSHANNDYSFTILKSEFPWISVAFIDSTLTGCGWRLYSAHQVLSEFMRTHIPGQRTQYIILKARKVEEFVKEENVERALATPDEDHEKIEVLTELQAARRLRLKQDSRHRAELEAQRLEEENTRYAEANGLTGECGCCFADYPLNRLVHCNGENPHQFCRDCARMNAETEIGKSKYELHCMSMDSCTGGFDYEQR